MHIVVRVAISGDRLDEEDRKKRILPAVIPASRDCSMRSSWRAEMTTFSIVLMDLPISCASGAFAAAASTAYCNVSTRLGPGHSSGQSVTSFGGAVTHGVSKSSTDLFCGQVIVPIRCLGQTRHGENHRHQKPKTKDTASLLCVD